MSGCPHPVLLTLQKGNDASWSRTLVLQLIPLRIPLAKGANRGSGVGTAPVNVTVGQEGPQAAGRKCRSIFCPGQRIVENKYMVEASVEMRVSEMWGEGWVKIGGSYFCRVGAGQALQDMVRSRFINVGWGILSHWERLGAGTRCGRVSMVRSGNCRHARLPQHLRKLLAITHRVMYS